MLPYATTPVLHVGTSIVVAHWKKLRLIWVASQLQSHLVDIKRDRCIVCLITWAVIDYIPKLSCMRCGQPLQRGILGFLESTADPRAKLQFCLVAARGGQHGSHEGGT